MTAILAIFVLLGALVALLVDALELRFTIDLFLSVPTIFVVYRLRTISGSRRGCFDLVETSHSCSSHVPPLGRPSSQPEESSHWGGEGSCST